MDDRKPDDTTPAPPPPDPDPKIPDPPPFDPDPSLIGDMEKGEKRPKESR
jgi:hypothetical protein